MRLRDQLFNETITYANSWVPFSYELGDLTDYLKLTTESQSNSLTTHGNLTHDDKPNEKKLSKGSVSSKVIRNRLNGLADNNTSMEPEDFKIEMGIPNNKEIEENLIDLEELKTSLRLLNLSINRNDELTNKRQFLARSINHLINSVNISDKLLVKMIFENLDESFKYEILRLYLNDSDLVRDFKLIEEEKTLDSVNNDETLVNDYDYDDDHDNDHSFNVQHLFLPSSSFSSIEPNNLDMLIFRLMNLWWISMRLLYQMFINPIVNLILTKVTQINGKYHILEKFLRICVDILLSVLGHLISFLNSASTHNTYDKRKASTGLGHQSKNSSQNKNKNKNEIGTENGNGNWNVKNGQGNNSFNFGTSELSSMILRRLLNNSGDPSY